MARPERVTAIVSQNGNAYEDGLGRCVGADSAVLERSEARIARRCAGGCSFEGIKLTVCGWGAESGGHQAEGYTLDYALVTRPGNTDIQLDLFLDYGNNVKLYPKFQEYFRKSKPPLLAIWGKNDPFFIPPGAEAFMRDNPNATVQFLDTGHFALETHVEEIAAAMRELLQKAI